MSVLSSLDFSIHCRGSRKHRKNTVLHLEEVSNRRTFLHSHVSSWIQTCALCRCQTNPGHVYEEIKDHPTEQTDCCYYSSVPLPQADEDPLYNTVQPHQHQQASHCPYAVVSLSNRCAWRSTSWLPFWSPWNFYRYISNAVVLRPVTASQGGWTLRSDRDWSIKLGFPANESPFPDQPWINQEMAWIPECAHVAVKVTSDIAVSGFLQIFYPFALLFLLNQKTRESV